MKKSVKAYIAGLLTAIIAFGTIGTAMAAYQKQATLDYTGIKITLDGQPITPADASGNVVEPFAVEGTTYLPVRGIASALGLGVGWDQATQTVELTSSGAPQNYICYPGSKVPMLDNFASIACGLSSDKGSATLYYYSLSSLPSFDENDENNYFAQYVRALISAGLILKDTPDDKTFIFTFGESNNGVAIYLMDPTIIILVGDTTFSLKNGSSSSANNPVTTPPPDPTSTPTISVSTAADLQDYLNQNMGSLETPLGTYNYTFKVNENDADYNPYDFQIMVDHDGPSPWYDIEYSISISQADKDETLALAREFQEEVYHTAAAFFPDKKLTGCFYDFYYEYPNIHAGYHSTQVLTWCNFTGEPFMFSTDYADAKLSTFHWYNERDDYKFN